MIGIGIDPSKRCTAIVLARSSGSGVQYIQKRFLKVEDGTPDEEAERLIARMTQKVMFEWVPAYANIAFISMEMPNRANHPISYTRKDGTKARRVVTGASQWLMLGRLAELLEDYTPSIYYPNVATCRAAIGLKPKSPKIRVIQAIEQVFGVHDGPKYEKEAIADASAAWCAGSAAHFVQRLRDG